MDLLSLLYLILFLGIAMALLAVIAVFLWRIAPEIKKLFRLARHKNNPVLSPPEYADWEAVGTFNPAAIRDDSGNVHIMYRAIGADGMSRFGYAVSEDGINFNNKSPYPIFAMQNPRNGKLQRFDPVMYPSGGSWGGSEDPRMVRIEGKIYLTLNAFDGWDFLRVAVSSINEKDFFSKKWKWSRPIFISPARQIHKNWVLFPEKINGKFAVLHSIVPKVEIEYVDTFNKFSDDGSFFIKSWCGPRTSLPARSGWDAWIRSQGPPPIKTDRGWLVLYHAHELNEMHKYKLGAMLLDLNDPTRITHRSAGPILEPDEWYENDWKPGVIYACGAVIKNGDLFIYYGGGDKHVCVAHTPLNELLDSLVTEN